MQEVVKSMYWDEGTSFGISSSLFFCHGDQYQTPWTSSMVPLYNENLVDGWFSQHIFVCVSLLQCNHVCQWLSVVSDRTGAILATCFMSNESLNNTVAIMACKVLYFSAKCCNNGVQSLQLNNTVTLITRCYRLLFLYAR